MILLTALVLLLTGITLNGTFGNLFSAGTFSFNYFASGDYAAGVFAAGKFSIGIFSIGIFSMGIFSIGIFNLGIYAIGIFIFARHKRLPELLHAVSTKPILMKPLIVLLIVLAGLSPKALSQIPNSGFELWSDKGAYMDPAGFATPNSLTTGTRYPVSRSADHFPASVGNYSIKLESNPTENLFGIALQNNQNSMFAGSLPAFPVSGHPTSLTGYYRYLPQNGDTMIILIQLFNNGSTVSVGTFISTDTVSDWKSFSIPFQNYLTADSASIILSSYYAFGSPPSYVPQGNSVLFVDNLNLNNLITSVSDRITLNEILTLFPNPASDFVHINSVKPVSLEIYGFTGQLVFRNQNKSTEHRQNVSEWSAGLYFIRLRSETEAINQTLIIRR